MTVLRSSNRQTKVQPPANFTGVVFSDEIAQGSAPDKLFAHLAMSEQTDTGEGTAWFEHVSGADYNAAPAPVS